MIEQDYRNYSYSYISGRVEATDVIELAIKQGSQITAKDATLELLSFLDEFGGGEFKHHLHGFINGLLDRIEAEVKDD
jgi:hypothetical protein